VEKVAAHSVHMTMHAKAALKKAQEALHGSTIGGANASLTRNQTKALREAEKRLADASQIVRFGNASHEDSRLERRLAKLQGKLDDHLQAQQSEREEMQRELRTLRQQLAGTEQVKEVDEIERLLRELERQEATAGSGHDELKAEVERLREAVRRMQAAQQERAKKQATQPLDEGSPAAEPRHQIAESAEGGLDQWGRRHQPPHSTEEPEDQGQPAAAVEEGSGNLVDEAINMPYGDLEPFGREDTAQELTEASIRESDAMVDQLERAEVAEEKRALFRSLTRLRGAAITSFDGVARTQTGELDSFNKAFQWRAKHPLNHLAEQEGDVSKWAFPNADF